MHWRQRRAYSRPRAAILTEARARGGMSVCFQSLRGSMADIGRSFYYP